VGIRKESEGFKLALAGTLAWQHTAQEQRLPRLDDAAGEGVRTDARAQDLRLAEACRSGAMEAYEELYRTQATKMKSIAMNLLGNAHDAEDAVQETFMKIHRGIRYFKGQSSFSTWTYRILMNSCYDLRRKRVRRQETPQQDLGSEDQPFDAPAPHTDHPLRMVLQKCVAQLTPYMRSVFLLYEVEGFKHSEIGAILNISETASKNALYQAKRRLREMLESDPARGKLAASGSEG
jgi:RNA polymerase sigma-70 factor, ECF subfamily